MAKIKVDVRPSEDFTRMHFSAREIPQVAEVRKLMRRAYSHLDVDRTPNGLCIDAFDAALIYPFDVPGIEFRLSPEIPRVVENRLAVLKDADGLRTALQEIRDGGKPKSMALLADVRGLEQLDSHQWVNVAGMTSLKGYGLALFDEQGAGKTISALFAFDVLIDRDEVDFALIVAPKSMIPEWKNDFSRFKGDLYKVETLVGSGREKVKTLRQGADVLVTNYETVVSFERELTSLARRYDGRCILIIDESFFVKNLDAKRTLAIKRIREWFGRAFVLCGTPAPNSPNDIVEQFNIVDFGLTFRAVDIPEEREAALSAIQRVIDEKGLYLRHLKTDVLPGLPSKRFQKVILPLEPVQGELYRATLQGLVADLETVTDTEFLQNIGSFLARRMALLRICSHPAGIVEDYSEVPTKLKALDDILVELIDNQGEKVVLWSFFKSSIDMIMDRYGMKYHPVRYDGTVTDTQVRRDYVRRFQEDNETMLFVGNPAAAGAGLTLHRARFAIYESMSNQAAHYLQSLDRIHRRGQDREVEYLILLCDRTIEINEYLRLEEKEAAGRDLLGDIPEEHVTRESMLSEAIRLLRDIVPG